MTWDELDADLSTWSIPGSRAKNGVTHIVPLPSQAQAFLRAQPRSTKARASSFQASEVSFRAGANQKTASTNGAASPIGRSTISGERRPPACRSSASASK